MIQPHLERADSGLFADTWPNLKVPRMASMVARGYSGTAIAAELADGTTPNQISPMVWKWGISAKSATDPRFTYADVPTPLAAKFRTQLAEEARRRGMELPELVTRMAETICRDGPFGAVLDA